MKKEYKITKLDNFLNFISTPGSIEFIVFILFCILGLVKLMMYDYLFSFLIIPIITYAIIYKIRKRVK